MSAHRDPILVLAPPFSGASFIAAVLDRHHGLCAVPELHLFMADSVGGLLDLFAISQGGHGDGLLRTVARFAFGAQSDGAIDQARGWLDERRGWSTAALLDAVAGWVAPARLVIPDTDSPLRPVDLARMRTIVPDAPVLQCLRHPYAMTAEHAAWLRERLFVPIDYKDHSVDPPQVDPQLGWYRIHRNIEQHLLGAGMRTLRLLVDRFDEGADDDLRQLCADLGLECDAADLNAMREPQAWVFGGYGPRAAPYGVDVDLLEPVRLPADWVVEPSLDALLPWRRDRSGFSPDLVALAQSYGYR